MAKTHETQPQSGAKKPAAAKAAPYFKSVAKNRRAWHDYHIEEQLECGLSLHGSEVKSLRAGKVDFADSYARIYEDQLWIVGLRISVYEKAFVAPPDPDRRRKLLVNRRELGKLAAKTDRAGYTLVPLEIYFHGSWAKVKIGLAKGKAKHDKRQTLKAREAKREIDRTMKRVRRG